MNKIDYSVVVPVFNSEESIEELFTRIDAVFSECRSYEIVFVEDGGTDRSWDILRQLKKKHPDRIKAIQLDRNYGQHNATLCGLHHAEGRLIITIDDDLQTPPEEIKKLIEKYKRDKPDVVYGYYIRKKHSFARNFGSWFLKKLTKRMEKAPGRGSSFRLLTYETAKKLRSYYFNFVYIDELLLRNAGRVEFVPVRHEGRKAKRSGYSLKKLIVLALRMILFSTTLPIKFMIFGGSFLSLLSILAGSFFLIRRIFFNIPLGFVFLFSMLAFLNGIILLSLGIIGEYINRILEHQNKRTPYLIKNIL